MNEFIILIAAALLIDAIAGDPHSNLHPVALFGQAAKPVEKFFRSSCGNGVASGFCAWLTLTGTSTFAAWLTVAVAGRISSYAGLALAAIWIYFCIALKSLIEHNNAIFAALKRDNLKQARYALSMIVSREVNTLDESGIVRGGIESISENLIDAVNSALFWAALGYLAGGVPGAAAGAVLLRTANTLDACWGYKNQRYLYFGRAAARIDDFMHFVPARLTLLCIALAAWFTGGSPLQALRCGMRHRKDHPSPNSTYGMAGFAGALNIRLGGPVVYKDKIGDYPYWGRGRTRLNRMDLKRAAKLAIVSALVFAALAGGISLL